MWLKINKNYIKKTEQEKEIKDVFNFKTLATNGLTAYNIYIYDILIYSFNDTINTPTSSQLWLSSHTVSSDICSAWKLLIYTIIQVS